MRLMLVFMACLFSLSANAEKIKPFTTDGCSAFPDGTWRDHELWLACCTAHDHAYWKGGTREQKLEADKKLRQCVADVGEPTIGTMMYMGVRIGGSPYFPMWYRWGYGWPYMRGYQALTDAEKEQIKQVETMSNQDN